MTIQWIASISGVRALLLGGLAIGSLQMGQVATAAPGLAQALPVPASSTPTTTRPLLKPGDSGAPVKQLQQELTQMGLYAGAVDGLYGATTDQAVRSLQQQQGFTVDGVAGAQTWQSLGWSQGQRSLSLPVPLLGANPLTFIPLVVAQPPPPPSALWLALMPLVPITGGVLTYLYQRRQDRR